MSSPTNRTTSYNLALVSTRYAGEPLASKFIRDGRGHTPFPRVAPACTLSAASRRKFCAAGSPAENALPHAETWTHTFCNRRRGAMVIARKDGVDRCHGSLHAYVTHTRRNSADTAGRVSPANRREHTPVVAHVDPVWIDKSTTTMHYIILPPTSEGTTSGEDFGGKRQGKTADTPVVRNRYRCKRDAGTGEVH